LRLGFSFPQSDTLDGTLEGERKGKNQKRKYALKWLSVDHRREPYKHQEDDGGEAIV
jgi:hypothetical protein